MSDDSDNAAASRPAGRSYWSRSLTDLSDKPFRLRRPPRRKRRLKRLFAPITGIAARLWRFAGSCRTAWTDMRERAGGAEGRLLRVFHGVDPGPGRSLAIYAHFAPYSGISEMVVRQLRDYAQLGFRVVFVTASPRFDEANFARISDIVELAIHRRNFGLDFGSWVDALALAPEFGGALDELLLVNDSVLGPIQPLDQPLAQMRAGGEGLFGMTDSIQHAPHLQSYFLLARGKPAIADMTAFLSAARLSANKRLVVRRFEIALSEHMRDMGHRVAALWGYDDLENELLQSEADVAALFAALPGHKNHAGGHGWQFNLRRQMLDLPLNPVHHFAGILVRRCGYPFLKTELVLKNPERLPEVVNWRGLIPEDSSVPVTLIEDHLAAYERPVRRSVLRPAAVPQPEAPPSVAEPPPSPSPAESDDSHPWRHTLLASWARRHAEPLVPDKPSLRAPGLLKLASRVPLVVSFSHDDYAANCGGVQNVIHAEQLAVAAEGLGYLHLAPVRTAPGLAEADPSSCFSVRIDGTLVGTTSFVDLVDVFSELGRHNAVLASVVHHLSGHAPEQVQALHEAAKARQMLVWLHDYGTLCGSPMLLRSDIAFCGGPPPRSAACMVCAYGADRPSHLARINALFDAAAPSFFAPSQVALDFWKSRIGRDAETTSVIPPVLLVPLPGPPVTRPTRKRLRIAHLGTRTFHKGWLIFAELAERHAGDGRYEFLQLGLDEGYARSPHVRHVPVQVGPGSQAAMADAVLVEEVDVVVNWSLCYETFSFTAHEAIAGGAFVVTHPEAGNIPHVIRDNAPRQGLIVSDAEELTELFATDGLRNALADARRARHLLVFGGASAEWLLARRAEAGKRSLRVNG